MWSDQWSQMGESAGSNMSLNITPGYPMNPMWMGTWHGPPPSAMGMYPYPVAMPPMGHVHSSRPTSPAHSIKSRKSHLSKKSRRKRDSDSDDEFEDRRSVFSHTERNERKSLSNRLPERTRLRDTASMPRELPRRNMERIERLSLTRNQQRSSTSQDSDDEMQSESQKDSEIFDELDEDKLKKKPSKDKPVNNTTSKASWECEHCTFVNDPGTRVCIICCKTSTAKPEQNQESESKVIPKNKINERKRIRRSASKDSSEIEAITSKIDKLISNNANKEHRTTIDEWKSANRKEGRTSRKITFWPGTKFTTNLPN